MLSRILFICIIVFTFFSISDSVPICENKFLDIETAQDLSSINEQILSDTENAYNPIPSPDGKMIAYVETGWNRNFPMTGMGRSHFKSNIKLMDANGTILSEKPLADAFLYGWKSDSKNLIGYRDWEYLTISIDGVSTKAKLEPNYSFFEESDKEIEISERVAYLEKENLFLWIRNEYKKRRDAQEKTMYHRTLVSSAIKTTKNNFLSFKDAIDDNTMLVPSPDERYIAMIGTSSRSGNNILQIYDRDHKTWSNLGKVTIHPDEDWDYIKPSWNPWFADSTKLVFISDKGIIISSPDGKDKKIVSEEKNNVGLVLPSPDGKKIAYVSFEPRPMKVRPDLKFYGGTIIWVIGADEKTKPQAITSKNEDKTYCLRWLNNQQVVFDRVADETFYKRARLWKATVIEQAKQF